MKQFIIDCRQNGNKAKASNNMARLFKVSMYLGTVFDSKLKVFLIDRIGCQASTTKKPLNADV